MHSKYPKGLFFLVFTEFWERFGYYLMIGIFTLYMTADTNEGGFGWDNDKAYDIFGTFIAAAYLTPFMGGLLADLKLGYRFSIILGGTLMGVGYCMLAIPHIWAFYTSLIIMVVGNGFFKPNISTLLGSLYNSDEFRNKKDAGYNIFYMGINVGAFICNFIGAIMLNKIGWHGAFIAAGVGMFIGVATFIAGIKYYKHVDLRRVPKPEDKPILNQFIIVLLTGTVLALCSWLSKGTLLSSESSDAFFAFCIPVIFFFVRIYYKSHASEKKSLSTMFTIFLIVILFWAIFKQNGTALTTYAKNYTNREIPQSAINILKTLGFSEKINYTKIEVDKIDNQFKKIKDENGKPIKETNYPAYFKNYPTQNLPNEGAEVNLVSTSIFQSINPFFVIVLTPLLVAFFAFLARKKMEPTTASKIMLGLLISALSTLVMVVAFYATNNGAQKASVWWLVGCYGVITVGELCLSPMGLSMVSKLSPPHLTALMMGAWSLATSIGNKTSSEIAKFWDKFEIKANYFWLNFALLMLAFFIMLLLLKRINTVFKK